MSTPAFRRSRSPIRGSDGSVAFEAKCRAGYTYARRLRLTVTRSAWSIRPRLTSGWRASSGRIGSPAASADVQPAGRRRFERRLQVAPEPALQEPGRPCRSNSS